MTNDPCMNCYIHGRLYSVDNCNTCNYYKAVEIIKHLLPDKIDNDGVLQIDFDKVINDIESK